ncbi:MAG TPA: cyclase family protein [Terriglobia bacterium]|nr:cyclase family protein [Terriglobia bacterium]
MMRSIVTMFVPLLLVACIATGQSWIPPAENQRCPSKWGAGDERGSGNLMKPEQVLKAAKLIRTGEVIELGQVLDPVNMPYFPGRQLNILTKRTNVLPQSNRRISNEEMVIGELGQVGTQLDGFSHQGIDNGFYNCFKQDQIATRNGFTRLGIENVGALMTRGVMIDVAALKGVEMLPDSYEITVKDLQDALSRQNLSLQAGDAVIVNTGWGKLWGKDNARYMKTDPGIGVAAADWLAKQNPMIIGSDNWSVEVNPNPDPKIGSPVHQILLAVNGVHMLESLKLDELSAKRVNEFAFILEPLKLKGATGSTVAPIAVH